MCGQEPDQEEGNGENGKLVIKSPTNKKARMKMEDLWSRARPKKGKGENGRLVIKSPTKKKARMKMEALWTRAQPIRSQG